MATTPGADDNEWIRLARAEVALLGNQLAEDHAQDLAAIEAQLAAAEAQQASDPAAAQKTWQAIVTLYGDKPWAAGGRPGPARRWPAQPHPNACQGRQSSTPRRPVSPGRCHRL